MVGQPAWATLGGEISRKDLRFEAKLWLDFACSRIMPSKNDQKVHIEETILITCIMFDIHMNFGDIVAVQKNEKLSNLLCLCLSLF